MGRYRLLWDRMARVTFERVEALELLGMTLAHLSDAESRAELSLRMPLLMAIRDKLAAALRKATNAMDKYRGIASGEIGSALVVVGLSAERAAKESGIRDDMIRVAHRAGASLRQLAEASGLNRKTITSIVSADR